MDSVDGLVAAEQIQEAVECLCRDPPHPGGLVRAVCLGSTTVSEAAQQLNLARPEFERILAGESDLSADLAVRMEALGWATADLWVWLQAADDLAQARRRASRAA